jgi:hypothetical protein
MAQTSLIIGDTNWAVKEDSLLGYNVIQNNYLPIPIDCVRATTATRVNEQGLIEIVPRNLFTYSEDFANAAWTKANVTVSSNVINSPIGTLTADKLVENSANDIHYINGASITFTAGTYTVSIFAKAAERNVLQIFLNGSANVDAYANFNLTTGVVSAFNAATATIQSVGNGWYRCNLTAIIAASIVPSAYFCIQTSTTATRAASYLGDGVSGIFIWGAQLENGSVATEYFPTTNRLDIPRIDYSTGTASLLVEPQRTNLALYSEQFNNDAGYISSGRPVITTNIAASPSGLLEADLLTYASGDSLRNTPSFAFTNAYTYSIFVKKDIGRYVTISGLFFTRSLSVGFDLDTKTCQAGGTVTDFGNGWLRLSISQVVTGDADKNGFFYVYAPNSLGVQDSAAGNRFYAWGCQIEEGTYPTSYIPTIASSVTRNADVISRTGISSLIGQTEGTMFVDVNLTHSNKGINEYLMQVWLDGSNRIIIYRNVSNFLCYFFVKPGGTFSFDSSISANGRHKIAFAYKNASNAFYIDGAQIEVNSSAVTAFSSLSNFDLGIHNASGSPIEIGDYAYKSAQLYKTRLTNSELASLTTI